VNDFGVQREGIEIGWLTGNAALDAEVGEDKARTAMKVHDLEVRLPDRIDRTLQPLEGHPEVRVVTEEAPPVLTPYPIELAIDGTRGLRITRNDMTVNATADLAIVYADPDLFLGGRIGIIDGEVDVLGKRFTVEQGIMRFDGSNELNPQVRLIAEHHPEIAGGSPVIVSVTGTLQEPEVTFSTDACPGSGGAVMYLLSSQCTADDPEMAAETEAAEDAYASAMMGAVGAMISAGTSGLGGGLVPRVSVESAGTGSEARVKAGVDVLPSFMRSFVRRVYIQGAGRVGGSTQQDAEGDPTPEDNQDTSSLSPDFLIELYFPYGLVGSGRYAPGRSWGLDLAWEP